MKNLKRNSGYYETIADKILEERVVTTAQFYDIIRETNEQMKISSATRGVYPATLKKFIDIVGLKWIDVLEDESTIARGRAIPRLYSFKLRKGFEKEDFAEIKAEIRSHFVTEAVGEEIVPSVKEKPKKEKVERKAHVRKEKYNRPTRKFFDYIVEVLVKASERKDSTLSYTEIKELVGIGSFNITSFDRWRENLMNCEVVLNAMPTRRGGSAEKYIRFDNPRGDLFSVAEKYKEYHGIDIEPEKLLGIKGTKMASKAVIRSTGEVIEKPAVGKRDIPKSNREFGNFYNSYHKFLIGGIIQSSGGVVEIDVLCSTLSKRVGLMATKAEVTALLKSDENFEFIRFGAALKLKDKDSWEKIREENNPKDFMVSSYARIGMTLEEVQSYLPKSRAVTMISENEGIYELVYDRSVHAEKSLMKLFRTFRGKDMLFEETLTNRLKENISIEEGSANKNDLAYMIETL